MENLELQNDLTAVKNAIGLMIRLQKAEDEIPDPPGFHAQCQAFAKTSAYRNQKNILSWRPPHIFEVDSLESFNQRQVQLSGQKLTALKMLDPPAVEVDEFPFKTSDGPRLEILRLKIFGFVASRIDNTLSLPSEVDEVVDVCRYCRQRLEKEFPYLVRTTPTQLNQCQPGHVFVHEAYLALGLLIQLEKDRAPVLELVFQHWLLVQFATARLATWILQATRALWQ